ncbi:M3 family oligoendopeptidase [bacterium]|nr:M3 family oligoendopeptidase [bacterium]
MVTNRINDLNRPSREYPRSYVPDKVDYSAWENLDPLFKGLIERKLDSKQALEQFLLDDSELNAVVNEEGSRRNIAMTCATDDPETEKAFLHFIENIGPKMQPYNHEIEKKILTCPYLDDLDKRRYEVRIRSCRNSVELFREENIPLGVETAKLSQQYQKTIGAMTVNFKGKDYTLPQMGIFMQEKDRELREEAWRLSTVRRMEDTGVLDEIFDKMLKLRVKIAANAGFDNFRAYQFRSYNRFDYTPDDCFAFHDAIEKYVVPVSRKLLEERRKSLSLDSIKPWDTACDRLGRDPLRPFEKTEKLVSGCREIFGKVDEELGNSFQQMIDIGLLDLDSRKGNAPGGYQSSLTEVRLPFIFMNAVGLDRDVFTLLHEGGHAFHQFAVRDESILEYRHAPMEFSEVASMTMELLGAPHLSAFYNPHEAARSQRSNLNGSLGLLPWIAIVDAFQHWIYSNPNHTVKERNDQFVSLSERFGAGMDWTGYEDELRYRWQSQLHIFEVPFYYIEYGIAQLGALQIWQNSRKDLSSAVEAYKSALKLGGSRPLPELFETAGAKFDFTENTIKPIMSEVDAEVERLSKFES